MFLKEFFYFPKSDRKVMVFLLVVAIGSLATFFFLGREEAETEAEEPQTAAQNEDFGAAEREYARSRKSQTRPQDTYYYQQEEVRAERFPFDPNTADSTELLRLGLSPWQVRNIYKYRSKGGIYRDPADFAQLYGLTEKQYRELEPYIRISDDYRLASLVVKRSSEKAPRDTILYPRKLEEGQMISLNKADTTQLKKVPGIGSYFARAIVGYRKRLGGYVNAEQLLEIDGFPEESLVFFKLDGEAPLQLNVNQLSLSQLRRHPYINYYQARSITDFRRLKRQLQSIDDLRLMPAFKEKDIERLLPYLAF